MSRLPARCNRHANGNAPTSPIAEKTFIVQVPPLVELATRAARSDDRSAQRTIVNGLVTALLIFAPVACAVAWSLYLPGDSRLSRRRPMKRRLLAGCSARL